MGEKRVQIACGRNATPREKWAPEVGFSREARMVPSVARELDSQLLWAAVGSIFWGRRKVDNGNSGRKGNLQ